MDHRTTGLINFEDFAVELAVLLLGSAEEKLRWVFRVYDLNKDGVLTRAELREVTAAVSTYENHNDKEELTFG